MNNNFFSLLRMQTNYYYMCQIVRIIKKYNSVHMVKVKNMDTQKEIIVDISAISNEPLVQKAISLKELGGKWS